MWYDYFSYFYDAALEELYAPFRPAAIEALRLTEGSLVIDVPCGTGQNLEALSKSGAKTLALDLSAGMLKKAQKRVRKFGLTNVDCMKIDAADVDGEWVKKHFGVTHVDAIICALGLSAFNDWEEVLTQLFGLLKPGGRFVIFDVFSQTRSLQTRSVEWVARADLSRECYKALEKMSSDFNMKILDEADPKKFGGRLYIASGTKPSL